MWLLITLCFALPCAVGLALARGNPLERLYRVARTLRIAEGTTEILKLTVAKDIRERGVEGL
mgnify:CR=1 FL=1